MSRLLLITFFLSLLPACVPSTPSPTLENTGLTIVPLIPSDVPIDEPSEEIIPTTITTFPTQDRPTCPNAPRTRLIIQERGRVTDDNDDTLNLREGPGTSFDVIAALNPLDQFTVLAGPACEGRFAWFRVRYRNLTGWIAEGDNELYYVEPYLTG